MTSIPGAVPSFAGEVGGDANNLAAPDLPTWANHISAELVALATEIGMPNPRGSATDVKARIVAIEASVAALQAAIAAISEKPAVRLATAAALPTNTQVGLTLVASANGALPTIDGVAPALGDRILVKNQTTTSKHGIYTVTDLGSVSTPWVLTRAGDADTSAEVTAGMYVTADEGSTQADTGWLLTTNNPIVLGTTGLTFAQFPASSVTADSAWHVVGSGGGEPAFTNSWVNFGSTFAVARFRKVASGMVVVQGELKSGVIGSSAFTLPAGYRPNGRLPFIVQSDTGTGRAEVDTDGTVTPFSGSNLSFALNGVSFYADA